MVGKARKRREKNYLAAHGHNKRLPPPPNPSSIDALPKKFRKFMETLQGSAVDGATNGKKNQEGSTQNKLHPKTDKSSEARDKRVTKSTVFQENASNDANEEKKRKKRKRKQANDLRFEAELEKLGGISKRKQRKKEFLKAKKKKQKNGKSEETLDLPKRDEVKFGEVAQAPPKFAVVPAFKKSMDASLERRRLQAIEAYRSRRGWNNRPGIRLPPVSASSDLL